MRSAIHSTSQIMTPKKMLQDMLRSVHRGAIGMIAHRPVLTCGAVIAACTATAYTLLHQTKLANAERQTCNEMWNRWLESEKQADNANADAFRAYLKHHTDISKIDAFIQADTHEKRIEDEETFQYEAMCSHSYLYDGWFNRTEEYHNALDRHVKRAIAAILDDRHRENVDNATLYSDIKYNMCLRQDQVQKGVSVAEHDALSVLSKTGWRKQHQREGIVIVI
jgi:hypothetical protein